MRRVPRAGARAPFSEGRKRLGSWRYFISKTFSWFAQILRRFIETQKCRFADPQSVAQSHRQTWMGLPLEPDLHLMVGTNEANAGWQPPIDLWEPAHRAGGRKLFPVSIGELKL